MANHKSAIKRARQNEKRRMRNKTCKTRVKNVTKLTRTALTESPEAAQSALQEAMRTIDKAASQGTLHRRTASRKIARLSRQVFKSQASDPA
ncbi:MAG: 30S ribosomal protein S20 [Proteobacteria bacterium]|nr:30S ribosomal protein S20 [Pseudomonadota bacterium]